ncbi:TOMM precursor leader peptide-binding protein [Spiractinospora alimapuensis]|uniref:TOMM precursor leader peptide-binding protein n=1 Tax=Spiractinospora alimapuensis TaxID=2820884 RepID=UPI001EECC57E|nr:TOMM precursor leader peptide-binding protein [Spiractinospora alimapuensis]QVQ51267.1 TOMM precursor leader peptide-binding protein [Spiractinospora alimapuensis]
MPSPTAKVEVTNKPALTLVGAGVLADAIVSEHAALGEAELTLATPGRTSFPTGSVVVVASDGWDDEPYPRVRAAAVAADVTWVPVRAELGRVVVGPAESPGVPGCVDCAEFRRRSARSSPQGHAEVRRLHGETMANRPSAWLTPLAADLVAGIVVDEVHRVASDPGTARTRNALVVVALDSLEVTTHRFLTDPRCVRCDSRPDDSASLARIDLLPRPKVSPETFRVRDVERHWDALERLYVDSECGLVHTMTKGSGAGVVTASAELGAHADSVEYGFGWTRSYHSSRVVALLEALERYGGTHAAGKRTVVHAPFTEVAEQALDPRTLGLYPPERHVPGFGFRRFTEDVPCSWVWGYSFSRSAPILVPENYVYYRLMRRAGPENPPFVYECSNGCALGSSIEEAIFYGILEVAERDSFLMTWYARMSVNRVDVSTARNPALPLLVETIEQETGYSVHTFDTTLEYGIPCVWTMAVNPTDDPATAKVACSGGSHLDPERAIERSLNELGPMTANFASQDPALQEQAREMVRDPSLVTRMAHHTQLYGHPDAFSRFDFLGTAATARPISDMPRIPASDDLRDDLAELLRRLHERGLDVIVVDQSTPEHRAGGFVCVKVIIPGTLPMTFGHEFRRVDGLPRLHDVPHALGYKDRPLRPEDISHHPHPFP